MFPPVIRRKTFEKLQYKTPQQKEKEYLLKNAELQNSANIQLRSKRFVCGNSAYKFADFCFEPKMQKKLRLRKNA